jgi:hypothetical protein
LRAPEAVAQEMHGAALPRASKHLRDRRLEARVSVGDRELHAGQAALDQAAQEARPERLGLGLADVDADDLAPPGLVHAVRDHQRLIDHAPTVAHLLDLGIEEQIGIGTLKRPRPERLHVLVQEGADPAHLALGHAQAEALDELVDAARGDAADVGLLDDRQQRLLRAPARLQEAREVAAPPELRNLQLDRARPRLPLAPAIAVAMRHPVIRAALAELGTD